MIEFEQDTEYFSDWWRITSEHGESVVLVFANEKAGKGRALAEKIDALLKEES